MKLLGIETSCDETAAAVVADGTNLLSNVISSQYAIHAPYGGVVPELASREHLRAIVPVVRAAVAKAGLEYRDLDAVAVTRGPGLIGALLVGVTYAKGLAAALDVPLIGVNHIEGHIHSVVLERRAEGSDVEFPAVALVVSGGHSHMFLVKRPAQDTYSYSLLGRTRDDAAGEAYDKVANLLGFGYPGGPVLDRLAPYGNPSNVRLPAVRMKGNDLDMSFSGLKTAVRRFVERSGMASEIKARRRLMASGQPSFEALQASAGTLCLDLIASFQHRVVRELSRRVTLAARDREFSSIIVAGGVAANRGLRKAFESSPIPCHFPTLALSTDNAAMIAAAAHPRLVRAQFDAFDLSADPSLRLA